MFCSYKWSDSLFLYFWFLFNWGINYENLNEAFLCVCVCACMFYLLKDINLEILISYSGLYRSYLTQMNYSLSKIKHKYWSRSGISSQELLPLCLSTIENKSMFLSYSQACGIFCTLFRLQATVKSVELISLGLSLFIKKKDSWILNINFLFSIYPSTNVQQRWALRMTLHTECFLGLRITEHRKSCTNVESYKVLNIHVSWRTLYFICILSIYNMQICLHFQMYIIL